MEPDPYVSYRVLNPAAWRFPKVGFGKHFWLNIHSGHLLGRTSPVWSTRDSGSNCPALNVKPTPVATAVMFWPFDTQATMVQVVGATKSIIKEFMPLFLVLRDGGRLLIRFCLQALLILRSSV